MVWKLAWPYEQMIYAHPSSCPRELHTQAPIGLWHLISTRRPDLIVINKKKRTCKIVDFAVPPDNRIKLKESEKNDKSLDLAWEFKKLWNRKVTILPIVIGALCTVTKELLKELEDLEVEGRVETIQQQHYWEQLEYWEVSWKIEKTCCKSNSSEKPSANADVKNSQWVINNNNNNNNNNNVKRRISTTTLLQNWKSCGTWKWRLY